MMGKIIFYEDKNFQGRSYETSQDCPDMSSHLSRCHSCRVESGCFMVYDRPNFMGNQYFMRRGEYSDYQRMMGMNDCIRSSRMIPMHRGNFRMRIYERENFGGQMHEMMDDCDSIQERYRMSDCQSCNVMDGHWLMYEQPHFRGRQMYMRPGEYRNLRDMGMGMGGMSGGMRFMSMRRIMDNMTIMSNTSMNMGRATFYEDRNFQGRSYECSSDCPDMSSYMSRCQSCRVQSGCFMGYERPNYMGNQFFMRRGEYSDYQSMMGITDGIRSCRMIPMHRGNFRMRIYERENFGGQMHEMMDDCDSIQERYRMSDCQSCNVMDGHWLMYEQPHFRGRQMYMRPGEYRNFRDMGMGMGGMSGGMRFMSMRRIMDNMTM
ncbi:beta/gamma crystallin domain-containing protein 2-like [Salvelinus fontinalis]|nr:beta/gamma crystallin domain-containing protein 2-like [Salvelinus fontinalis]